MHWLMISVWIIHGGVDGACSRRTLQVDTKHRVFCLDLFGSANFKQRSNRPYVHGNNHVRGAPARLSWAWRTGLLKNLFAFACAANQNLSTWVKSSKKHMPAVERHVCIVY